jgi:hypothetical protein
MHSMQIATPGSPEPAINMSTCGCALPQKLHFGLLPSTGDFRSSLSGIKPAYRPAAGNHVRQSSPRRTLVPGLGQQLGSIRRQAELGATLGATQTNGIAVLRTYPNSGQERTLGSAQF